MLVLREDTKKFFGRTGTNVHHAGGARRKKDIFPIVLARTFAITR